MRQIRPLAIVATWIVVLSAGGPRTAAGAQEPEGPAAASVEVSPSELRLEVGETAELTAVVRDEAGNVLEDAPVLFFSLARRSVGVTPAGQVEAYAPGDFEIMVRVPDDPEDDGRRGEGLTERIPVHVPFPPLESVEFVAMPGRYWAGTTIRPELRVLDVSGALRTEVEPQLESGDPSVVQVTHVGHLRLLRPGSAEIRARIDGLSATLPVRVEANPTSSVRMTVSADRVRTGDVVHVEAVALDAGGDPVPEMPVQYAYRGRTDQAGIGEPPSGRITEDGRFVADLPGEYTVVAAVGDLWESATITATPRDVRREIELVGHARVADRKTSDLWVWEGPDGRDYAVTGTWGAAGHAYFWDVTDPRNIQMIDTVKVDARTVNDVKVSEDGRVCIISREGASDRKNGLVILDVSDLGGSGARVVSRYDDQLTGGVHNVYIEGDHVYALSAGRRYDVINIEDPANPHRVGRFELDTPGHSIHDVWVERGVAVSSNWDDGVVLVDVGGGGKGGAPNDPVFMGSYAYPSGWNHAAFPYWSESTGKFYVFAGDEAFPRERNPMGTDRFEGPPVQAAGWIHVIDFTDLDDPREVARYQVPYGGTHNFWVQDDVLYVAYYNAGLRVVDVSGELLGDLYRQGREIAYFLPDDPQGFKPNARRTWGTMPHKGHILFADNNSGLWAVRLVPEETAATED